MVKTYTQFILEKSGELRKAVRDKDHFLTKDEFLKLVDKKMPDELIEMIYNWDKIKKSPYSQSYYNGYKDWHYFKNKGLRVADHWNFYSSDGGLHCRTNQPVENNKYWYVGKHDTKTGTYDIIATYPILDRRNSTFVNQKFKEMAKQKGTSNLPDEDRLKQLQEFKQKVKLGQVNAKLPDGRIVKVEWRGTRDYGKDKHYVIKYMDNGELIETPNYEIIGEVLPK